MIDAVPPFEDDKQEQQKKKDKLRAAWISFIGRIVAQIVGALATVVLGLMLARRMIPPAPAVSSPAAPSASPTASTQATGVSIAVLPLQNLSGDPKQEYFADGMTEELIASLAKIDTLRVISRTSAMQFKGAHKPLPDIARELRVSWVVEGSVVRDGSRVRVIAQLVDAASDQHVWAETYDRQIKDIFNIQTEVAGRIARAVNVALTPASQARLERRRALDPDAYIPYLRGRYAWNQRTQDGFESALRFFEQAVAADPGYAEAYAGLADTYSFLGAYEGASRDGLKKASAAARRAVELDGTLAEAHTSLAWMRFRAGWDWAGAEASFHRAIELNPGYATARQWYASFLSTLGRHGEAVPEARRALDLDPLSPVMHRSLAVVYLFARQLDEAEASARQAIELDPQVPTAHLTLARVLSAKGDVAGAIAAAERVPPDRRNTDYAAYLGYFYGRGGQKARGQEELGRLRKESSEGRATAHNRALVHLGLGDLEAAMAALQDAVKERSPFVLGLKTQPILDPLRADARFPALVQAVGLPE